MNTRRYPRTLQEAFGPYTNNEIHEPRPPIKSGQIIGIPFAVAVIGWLIEVFAK